MSIDSSHWEWDNVEERGKKNALRMKALSVSGFKIV